VNSGSDGSDGAFNPTTNIVINMADHPIGIYQYTSVNISNGIMVTFIPNPNNTAVYWLVQSNVVINGTVDVSGHSATGSQGGTGGPGGWAGGNGAPATTAGQGPGGGSADGASATYNYGNLFLIPLLGGSGGGGATASGGGGGGGGGGGAILIAASGQITIAGTLRSDGGLWGCIQGGDGVTRCAGYGSGGGIRLVASSINGAGTISAGGLNGGRVRLDTYVSNFAGRIASTFTLGSQFVIIPTAGQLPQLTVTSVGGVPVSASPTGALQTPDAVLSAQQNNPIPIVVSCANLPLNTLITVSVTPANGSPVSATGYNTTGTFPASTATISINMPLGGGLIYATAATSN
jgi:hypothetical protein